MITSINEFRKHLHSNPINEMSYASLQGEIDSFTQQLQALEATENPDPKQIEILKRKIQTRQNYINRLKAGRKTSATPALTPGEKITYQEKEYTIVSVTDTDVVLANEATTLDGKPVRITNIEGNDVFVNTSKDGGGFNNFAKKINIAELQGLTTVAKSALVPTKEPRLPRQPKEPKVKPDRNRIMAIRQAIKVLNKNIDSVKPSIDKFKDRTPEEQAKIFKTRFNMPEDIELIVAALQEMGLVAAPVAPVTENNIFEDGPYRQAQGYPVTEGILFDKLKTAIPEGEFTNVMLYGKWEVIDGNVTAPITKEQVIEKLNTEFNKDGRFSAAAKQLSKNVYKFRLYSTR